MMQNHLLTTLRNQYADPILTSLNFKPLGFEFSRFL